MVSLVVNFWRSVIIVLWQLEMARRGNFVSNFASFGETTLYGKIVKILLQRFTWRHRSTLLCSNVVKFVWREIGQSCVIYLTKQISAASQTVATARIAFKICQGHPPAMFSQCSRLHPNRITFGGVIAERVNTVFAPYSISMIPMIHPLRVYN